VLGLGSFGTALARRLAETGCRVTGVDIDRETVAELKEVLYEAIIADGTDADAIRHLPIETATAVFISMGEDITRSLLATLHVRDRKPKNLVVKGVTREHGRILKSLGVDRVVFPEAEMAVAVADRATRPSIIDYLPIDSEYSFMEMSIPESALGKTLGELNWRQQYQVWVVGVKDALTGKLSMFPDGTFTLSGDQMLLVVGKHPELDRLATAK
jgi:trk system potassium uptake protein TrkA